MFRPADRLPSNEKDWISEEDPTRIWGQGDSGVSQCTVCTSRPCPICNGPYPNHDITCLHLHINIYIYIYIQ